jgi:DNA polymerase elongation subunit (family B)
LYQCIKRDKKLRSYGLNAVAQQFLGKGKIEMDYTKINELQKTPEGRAILGYYCVGDSFLPWELAIQLKMIINYIQVLLILNSWLMRCRWPM